MGSGGNVYSSKLSCMSPSPAYMNMFQKLLIKNEGARVVTTFFSHYKSMGMFQDAQGQLTLQSLVRSGRISNSLYM